MATKLLKKYGLDYDMLKAIFPEHSQMIDQMEALTDLVKEEPSFSNNLKMVQGTLDRVLAESENIERIKVFAVENDTIPEYVAEEEGIDVSAYKTEEDIQLEETEKQVIEEIKESQAEDAGIETEEPEEEEPVIELTKDEVKSIAQGVYDELMSAKQKVLTETALVVLEEQEPDLDSTQQDLIVSRVLKLKEVDKKKKKLALRKKYYV